MGTLPNLMDLALCHSLKIANFYFTCIKTYQKILNLKKKKINEIYISKEFCFFSRASLQNVFFPSVTLCNINQGRRSLFHAYSLDRNKAVLEAVLGQAYFGTKKSLPKDMVRK